LGEPVLGSCARAGAGAVGRVADAGVNEVSLMWLAELRGRAGDPDGAERLYREAADSGDPFALAKLAGLWEKTGDRDGAERLAREAADAGNTNAMTRLAEMRRKAGDREGAERLRRGLDADNDVPRAEG
ncbi:tetratricopeptide repeat protein, partial [Embleya sp. NPDC059213]|uniref:tetratricopeptide repeat protein n=1 Tax=Embleya sp. NPDC059213 TaxID=3346771 RepID=UPI00367CB635